MDLSQLTTEAEDPLSNTVLPFSCFTPLGFIPHLYPRLYLLFLFIRVFMLLKETKEGKPL